jgi:hypothetical protein
LAHGVSGINGSIKGRGVNLRKLTHMHGPAVEAMAERGFVVRDYRADSGAFRLTLQPPWDLGKFAGASQSFEALAAYERDMRAAANCDVTLLLLDAVRKGRSSHWESGAAAHAGKKVILFVCPDATPAPETVYAGTTIVNNIPDLLTALDAIASFPRASATEALLGAGQGRSSWR